MSESGNAPGATVAREGIGRELVQTGETAVTVAAARARATVEARFIVAMKNRRDVEQARQVLLKECKRFNFALEALYYKPISATPAHYRLLDAAKKGDVKAKAALLLGDGGGARGASIRLIEAALRALTNIQTNVTTVYEDDEKRVIKVEIMDLEANVSVDQEFIVGKTVERASCPDDVTPVRTRTNARGKPVFVLEATEDEIQQKTAALVSKAMRTQGKRLIPADLLEEAEDECRRSLEAGEAKEDPDKARKEIADAFATVGVTPLMLKEYLGHELATIVPAERTSLRLLFKAIKNGETSFSAACADVTGAETSTVEGAATPKGPPKTAEEKKAEAKKAATASDAAKPAASEEKKTP